MQIGTERFTHHAAFAVQVISIEYEDSIVIAFLRRRRNGGHGPKGRASPQLRSASPALRRQCGAVLEVLDGASALRLATAAGRRRTEWSEW